MTSESHGTHDTNVAMMEAKSSPTREEVEALVERLKAVETRLWNSPSLRFNGILATAVREAATVLTALLEQRDALGDRFAEEVAIVNRIWAMFGEPSHDELAGRSIYDLITEERTALTSAIEQTEAMRSEWDDMRRERNAFLKDMEAAESRAATLEARVRVLEEALEPFAAAGDLVPPSQDDIKVVAHVPAGPYATEFQRMKGMLTAGDLRRARTAMETTK